MSFFTCVKVGAATGLAVGLISSSYFTGATERANKNDNPSTFGLGILSMASFIGAPIFGAATGVGYYGLKKCVKYFRTAPGSTQASVLALVSLGIAITGAYKIGTKDIYVKR